jgi:peptide/nickel transport system ATP-binding protein
MSASIVEVRDVHKTFDLSGPWPWSEHSFVPAVQGVTLTVESGEVVALVGQSGSGKTTLSRIILGLEEPTSGEIHLKGIRWDGLSEGERRKNRRHFQYIPQDAMAALDPQQTAVEHIAESYRVLGGADNAEALVSAIKILTDLGLGERLHALPREMSGGEQRRVTLARVLALEPKLVVADEPTSGLDPERRDSVLEELVGNLSEGSACILVTHDMSEARRWCNRIYVMLAGRVIEEIDLSKDEPKHPYARLLFDPWSEPLPKGQLSSTGCPFQRDCSLINDEVRSRCSSSVPSLQGGDLSHRVACHYFPLEEA